MQIFNFLRGREKKEKANSSLLLQPRDTNYSRLTTKFKQLLYDAATGSKSFRTASFVGSAGIAPLSVTVRAPQAFAKSRASLSRFSSCYNNIIIKGNCNHPFGDISI